MRGSGFLYGLGSGSGRVPPGARSNRVRVALIPQELLGKIRSLTVHAASLSCMGWSTFLATLGIFFAMDFKPSFGGQDIMFVF